MCTRIRTVIALFGLTALLLAVGGCSLLESLGNRPPQARFLIFPSVPLMSTEVFFDASESSDPEGKPLSYQWTFGDGQQDTEPSVSHVYAQAGVYQVTLTVTDEGGAKDSDTQTLVVANPVGRLVSRLNAPGPQPSGLAWDGQALWIVDDQTSKLYRIDPQTGRSLSQLDPLPGSVPEGLAWDGQTLWVAEAGEGLLYQLNPQNGQVLQSFALPGVEAAFPTGLAWDGQALWVAEGIGIRIYRVDPRTQKILKSFPAPGELMEDLAWDGQALWVLDAINGIYQLDPQSGQILKALADLPEGSPKGLLWLGRSLWLAIDNQLYRMEPPSK